MPITTERLILRPLTDADLDAMHAVWSDPEVMDPVPSKVLDRAESRAKLAEKIGHQDQHGFGKWAMVEKASGTVIGECGLEYLDGGPDIELGYKLARAHWSRGLALEAARACLEWALTERPEQVVAIADAGNARSARVLVAIGMTRAGTARHFGRDWDLYRAVRLVRPDEADRAYYERGEEAGRLDTPVGQLEFERTKEIVLRRLPPPPAVVADIGGGPGRYAHWLAGLGYQVRHRDLMPFHVLTLAQRADVSARIQSSVADARNLDLADASVDAVLFLGALYHLRQRTDRLRALAEARRVVRQGGPVFVAAISRWATRVDGILKQRISAKYPQAESLIGPAERTGQLPPLHQAAFSAFTHRPRQLRAEVSASGLRVMDVVCVEGPAYLLADLGERLADENEHRIVLETARALERVPELLGVGPHLLVTAQRT